MKRISLFFLLSLWLISCQAKQEPTNVFPVNVPTHKPYVTVTAYCIDNKVNVAHVEFDGQNYIAVDSNGNTLVYPVTAKVAHGKCE